LDESDALVDVFILSARTSLISSRVAPFAVFITIGFSLWLPLFLVVKFPDVALYFTALL
jgi:hypothetical protein